VPEQATLGELAVGVGRRARPGPQRGRRRAGQQQLDQHGWHLGLGRRQKAGRRREVGRRLGEQPGRVAQLENRGEAVRVDEDGRRVAGQIGLLDPRAGREELEQRRRPGVERGGTAPAAEAQTDPQPLERPAATQPEPREGEHGQREHSTRHQPDRAVDGADGDRDRGDLGGDQLTDPQAEQPSTSERPAVDLE
jgi:hypothetical protein